MLQDVSWTQYFTILLVATILYYLLVWIFLFKARIPAMSSIGSIGPKSRHTEDAPDEVLTTAQHVMDELRPLVRPGANINELVFSLQQNLVKYNNWQEAGFRETIIQFILRESQSKCSIRLSEEDLGALWK